MSDVPARCAVANVPRHVGLKKRWRNGRHASRLWSTTRLWSAATWRLSATGLRAAAAAGLWTATAAGLRTAAKLSAVTTTVRFCFATTSGFSPAAV